MKKYRVPSVCQQAVLSAFEEEGWPAAIDDPLPPQIEQDPKRRLRDTIKSLNTNQTNAHLAFPRRRKRLRVLWEIIESAEKLPAIRVRKSTRAA